MDKSRVGERGTSVLGALVLALMLGTGAVVTFELAGPSPSTISQTRASGVLAAAPKTTAAPKAAAQTTCRNIQACDQETKVNVNAILSQPCVPGFKYYMDVDKDGKVTVEVREKYKGKCPNSAA